MAKVVTSQGLTEFVQEGKFQTVANHKKGQSNEAPPLEAVKAAPTVDVSAPGESNKPVQAGGKDGPLDSSAAAKGDMHEHDEPLTDEEKALPEKAQKEIQRAKRAVNKKHAEMMEAREEAESDRRLAEQQYNERMLIAQRLAAREAELEALKPKAAPEPEHIKPTIDDKNADGTWKYRDAAGNVDWDRYTDAKADFAAETKIRERDAQQAEERAKVENAQLLAKHTALEEKAKKAHDDWDKVMGKIAGTELDKPPRFVLGFLNESEQSAEVRYYLATHPDETKKLFEMTPIRGIKELGKIEDQLIKPSTVAKETPATSGAIPRGTLPTPITPLTGEGDSGIQTDPSKMSFSQLRAYERAREAAKRGKH
jgi:hypothetical protein